MRLQTLKPRLKAASLNRIQAAPAAQVERKRGSAGVRDRIAIRKRDCGLCQKCREQGKATIGVAVDHKTPLWAGGSDEPENKWLLCKACHDEKTAEEAKQRAAGGFIG